MELLLKIIVSLIALSLDVEFESEEDDFEDEELDW
jgi:hypothetical protein